MSLLCNGLSDLSSMEFCQMCTRLFDRSDVQTMKFDDFIQCCVMLRALTESFKKKDTNRSGIISVSYEQVKWFMSGSIPNLHSTRICCLLLRKG